MAAAIPRRIGQHPGSSPHRKRCAFQDLAQYEARVHAGNPIDAGDLVQQEVLIHG
jgi:hypothetical protein